MPQPIILRTVTEMADVSFEKQNERLPLRMNTCILITTRKVTKSAKLNGTTPSLGHIQTLFRTNSR